MVITELNLKPGTDYDGWHIKFCGSALYSHFDKKQLNAPCVKPDRIGPLNHNGKEERDTVKRPNEL